MAELYKRYNVTRVDGTPITVPCFVLELRPDSPATIAALRAYADTCGGDRPELAADLTSAADNLEQGRALWLPEEVSKLGPDVSAPPREMRANEPR